MKLTFNMKFSTRNDFLPKGTKRRAGTKNKGIKFVVLHDTGNPNSTAQGNVNYYKNSAKSQSASAHVFIDDKEIIICVPLDEKAWHVLYNVPKDNLLYGYDANDTAIGVELCYFPNDKARSLKAYEKYVWFNAWLAYKYKLNIPKDFVGHHILDPGRKSDPVNALKLIGKSYQQLLNDIANEYEKCTQAVKGATKEVVKTTAKEDDEMKFSSPSLQQETELTLGSKARREIIVKTAIKGGANKTWLEKLEKGTITDADLLGLAAKYLIDTNK